VYMLAALATGNAHAQTVVGATNSNTIVQGASSTTIKSQYTRIEGGSQVTIAAPNTVVQGTLRVTGPINAASINLASPAGTLNVASELLANKQAIAGKASLGQVNAVNEQVNAVRNSVTNLTNATNGKADQSALDATNGRVTVVEGQVVDLDSRKADKVAVTDDIAAAKGEAIAVANGYTDSEVVRANSHTDTGDRRTLSSANAYTDQQIGQVRKEVNAVGAVAMAASVVGGVSVAEGKSTAVTAAVGNYGNATAIAVGVTHIVAPNKRVFATISRASGSKTGVGLGASFSF